MKPAPSPPPRLLLGATSLDLPVFATRDRALEVAGRFREPESLAVTLIKSLDAGAEAVYAGPSSTLRAALAELRRPVPILARLPLTPPGDDLHYEHPLLVEPVEDDAVGHGWSDMRAGVTALGMLPATLEGNLVARVAARCERQAPALGARELRGVAIAAPVTDLALAAGQARFFERMTKFGRARFGGVAGFETHNLAVLLARLHEWGIEPDFVIGAINPRGFRMFPDPASVLAVMKPPSIPVIATELRAGGTIPLASGARYAREQGAWGLLPELVDLDDVAGELRAIALER